MALPGYLPLTTCLISLPCSCFVYLLSFFYWFSRFPLIASPVTCSDYLLHYFTWLSLPVCLVPLLCSVLALSIFFITAPGVDLSPSYLCILYLSVFFPVHLYIYLLLCLSVFLFVHPSPVYLSVFLSHFLPVCLIVHSLRLSTCLTTPPPLSACVYFIIDGWLQLYTCLSSCLYFCIGRSVRFFLYSLRINTDFCELFDYKWTKEVTN